MRTLRTSLISIIGLCVLASSGTAQAPAAGPLVLLLPASPRDAGLGNATVALRDEYSIFANPAQVSPTNGIGAAFGRYDWNGTSAAVTSATAVGPVTYGWGIEAVEFKARNLASYPFAPDEIVQPGTRNAISLEAGVAASFLFRGFRTGVGVKYAEDRVDGSTLLFPTVAPIRHGVLLGDIGAAHSLWSGILGLSVQDIGDHSRLRLPTQATLGWLRQIQAGEFDLGFAAEVSERNKWLGAGGGVEANYGWIEGWSVTGRAGMRRPETAGQHPFGMGGGLNADRLSLDYALEFFDHSRFAHLLSIRWR